MSGLSVWLMVSLVHSGYAFGPEFTTRQKCEAAAKTIQQSMANWSYSVPTCIRIEK